MIEYFATAIDTRNGSVKTATIKAAHFTSAVHLAVSNFHEDYGNKFRITSISEQPEGSIGLRYERGGG